MTWEDCQEKLSEKKQTVCIYHHSLGKSEGKNETVHLCLFVYALKMYRWKYKKPRTEVTCGKGGGRLCSMESQAKDRRHSTV